MDRDADPNDTSHGASRREFIKKTTMAIGAVGAMSASGGGLARAADKPKGLPLSIAGYKFERIA